MHQLGQLVPGRHRLTIRVDNRMIHPVDDRGHLYTEHTQTIWNGIVGRIELRPRPTARLELVRVSPDAHARTVAVEGGVDTGGKPTRGKIVVILRGQETGRVAGRTRTKLRSLRGDEPLRVTATMETPPMTWDEFTKRLHIAELVLNAAGKTDRGEETFGFRTLERDSHQIRLTGRKLFVGGNLDCVHFPLTGHPPNDVESWRHILRIYKEHGLNHVRFHSWCPPEAAFRAADEMGICIQIEILWIDSWMAGIYRVLGPNAGAPRGVGRNVRSIDQFVRAEMRRILDVYGNHPSFVLFGIGNELGDSDFDVMGHWIQEDNTRDPRRLYAVSTARGITASDDYTVTHQIPSIGRARGRVEAGTHRDYEAAKAPVPVAVAHDGPGALENARYSRHLAGQDGLRHAQEFFAPASIQTGAVTPVGRVEFPVKTIRSAKLLKVSVSLQGTEFASDRTVVVFPANIPVPVTSDVVLTRDLMDAISALEEGCRVVLPADSLRGQDASRRAAWLPLYWSASFVPQQKRETLGAIVRLRLPGAGTVPHRRFRRLAMVLACSRCARICPRQSARVVQAHRSAGERFHFNHKLSSISNYERAKEDGCRSRATTLATSPTGLLRPANCSEVLSTMPTAAVSTRLMKSAAIFYWKYSPARLHRHHEEEFRCV